MRQTMAAVKMLVALTIITGVVYPLVIWAVGQAVLHDPSNGSLVTQNGSIAGSSLIGQEFRGDSWFHGRPSAGHYDTLASGASNLGPNNEVLVKEVQRRQREIAASDNAPVSQIPPDAVTASGSGLDPFISPAYAELQVGRVAAARGLPTSTVRGLVDEATQGRMFGFLGEPRVNVLLLNLALARH